MYNPQHARIHSCNAFGLDHGLHACMHVCTCCTWKCMSKRSSVSICSSPLCRENLRADEGAEYDQIIELNLSELEPHINGPFTPDLAHPLSKFAEELRKNKWPTELKVRWNSQCMLERHQDSTPDTAAF